MSDGSPVGATEESRTDQFFFFFFWVRSRFDPNFSWSVGFRSVRFLVLIPGTGGLLRRVHLLLDCALYSRIESILESFYQRLCCSSLILYSDSSGMFLTKICKQKISPTAPLRINFTFLAIFWYFSYHMDSFEICL
jgi:hypothetical protein